MGIFALSEIVVNPQAIELFSSRSSCVLTFSRTLPSISIFQSQVHQNVRRCPPHSPFPSPQYTFPLRTRTSKSRFPSTLLHQRPPFHPAQHNLHLPTHIFHARAPRRRRRQHRLQPLQLRRVIHNAMPGFEWTAERFLLRDYGV
jgi:hypothetical protein